MPEVDKGERPRFAWVVGPLDALDLGSHLLVRRHLLTVVLTGPEALHRRRELSLAHLLV